MEKLGFRKSLMLVFGLMMVMFLLYSLATYWILSTLQSSQRVISDVNLPKIIALRTLEGQFSDLTEVGSLLRASQSAEERAALLDMVAQLGPAIEAEVQNLSGFDMSAEDLDQLLVFSEQLKVNLTTVADNMDQVGHISAQLDTMIGDAQGTISKIANFGLSIQNDSTRDANSDLSVLTLAVDQGSDDVAGNLALIDRVSRTHLENVAWGGRLRETALTLGTVLEQIRTEESTEEVDVLAKRLNGALSGVRRQLRAAVDDAAVEEIAEEFGTFRSAMRPRNEESPSAIALQKTTLLAAVDEANIQSELIADSVNVFVGDLVDQGQLEAEQSSNDLSTIVASTFQAIPIIVVTMFVVLIGFYWLVVNRGIVKRLTRVSSVLSRVAEGDLNAEVQDRGSDEIADMARVVSVFRENALQNKTLEEKQVKQAQQHELEKATALKEIADDFRQSVGTLIEQVSAATQNIEEEVKLVLDTAQNAAGQSADAQDNSRVTNENIDHVFQSLKGLSGSIDGIKERAYDSESVVDRANTEIKEARTDVSELDSAAKNISNAVSMINDIAEQTNMLALNATIEAARAGEYGKGFAIVASEVKNLALGTTKATEDIRDLVVNIQRTSHKTSKAVDRFVGVMASIKDQVSTISHSVEQQTTTTREIETSMEDAASSTKRVNDLVGSVLDASQSTGDVSERLMTDVANLSSSMKSMELAMNDFLAKITSN